MAASVNCCLKAPSPPATATTTKLTHLSPRPASNDSVWGRRSMAAAAACVVVLGIATEAVSAGEPVTAVGARRWSEQRMCPSWHTNSLENIVPENLPRRSGRRKMEAVGRSSPAVVGGGPVVVLRHNSNCFSL